MDFNKKYINLIHQTLNSEVITISLIANSGSNRQYYRVKTSDERTHILTINDWVEENRSYFYFQNILKKFGAKVPEIIGVDASEKMYIQEDIGDVNLLQSIQKEGFTNDIYRLAEQSLLRLAEVQLLSKNKIDYQHCYDFQCFDENVVLNDLFYFKNYFLDRLEIPYSKWKLIQDINKLSERVSALPKHYFLYRDFQSRNIFVKENEIYFIDFQGGMNGFIGYDLVSFLYQAKANFPQEWKEKLKNTYFNHFISANELTINELEKGFQVALVLRFFQVLGAYGLRGLVEQKSHFRESLILHLDQIKLLNDEMYLTDYPYLEQIVRQISSQETLEKVKHLMQ